jgi:hypothetical protein
LRLCQVSQAFEDRIPFEYPKRPGPEVLVRLTRKLANFLNGLNVTDVRVGDVIELPQAKAMMLVTEGWAEQVSDHTPTERLSPAHQQQRRD